jgi:hypothetical protein
MCPFHSHAFTCYLSCVLAWCVVLLLVIWHFIEVGGGGCMNAVSSGGLILYLTYRIITAHVCAVHFSFIFAN